MSGYTKEYVYIGEGTYACPVTKPKTEMKRGDIIEVPHHLIKLIPSKFFIEKTDAGERALAQKIDTQKRVLSNRVSAMENAVKELKEVHKKHIENLKAGHMRNISVYEKMIGQLEADYAEVFGSKKGKKEDETKKEEKGKKVKSSSKKK